jgi:uncharacterized pyridoxal phosphate-containing UPF0001 family protein
MPRQCINRKVAAETVTERYLIEHIRPMIKDRILQYQITEQSQGRERLPERIAGVERKLERLKNLYIEGLIEIDAYKADRAAMIAQMEDLQRKAAERPTEGTEGLKRLLKDDVWELYADFTPEEKRRFWRGIIRKIDFSADREYTVTFL